MFIQIQKIHPISVLFLDLAKYLLTQPDLLQEGYPLFPGDFQYERFVKTFHKVISKNKEDFDKLGVKPCDIGSHYTRKGSITIVCSGCTLSPSISLICVQARWSMVNVNDRYIHYEKAGIRFVVEVSLVFHIYVSNLLYPKHILNQELHPHK